MDQGNAPSNTGEYAMQKRRKTIDASNVGQASGLRQEVTQASLLGATKGGYKETTSGKTTWVITDFRNGMELPGIVHCSGDRRCLGEMPSLVGSR